MPSFHPITQLRNWLTPIRKRFLWWGITAVSLILIFASIFYTWQELPENSLQFNPIYLGAAVAIYIMTYGMHLLGWHAIALLTFGRLPLRDNVEAVATSDLVKYLPTVAWYIANRVHFYEQRQIPRRSVIAASLLEMVILVGSGGALYLSLLLTSLQIWWLWLIVGLIGGVIIYLFGARMRHWWQDRIVAHQQGSVNQLKYWITAVFWYGISWPAGAIFLAALIHTFVPVTSSDYFSLLNIWLIAGLAGTIVSLSVGTIGIAREATLTFLLTQSWPFAVSATVAILVKIILTIGQVASALLLLGLFYITKKSNY